MACSGKSLRSAVPSPGRQTAPHAAGGPLLVLVVDDAPEIRLLLRLILEQGACRLEFAADAAQALAWLAAERPDLVLLDISLGSGPDGLELCGALKRVPGEAFTKVVMLTADDDPHTVELARACGADGYVVKPFTPTQILGLVDSFEVWRLDPARRPPAFWPVPHALR